MKTTLPSATSERRNPNTRGLDLKSTRQMLRILNQEDARVPAAVARQIPWIARAVDRTARALKRGGRLFYVGAGSSGRLGVLDAAECPPTFGVPPGAVQAVIAGGTRALQRAVEGAEDSQIQGRRDLAARRLRSDDVVVGLTASGSTPYVLGALRYAQERGAVTIGVTVNPGSPLRRRCDIVIAPAVGPEAIAGSTRLKAGTAQKLVLNMLSTGVMVRLGRTYDNWMINVALTNQKLQRRGARILAEAAGTNMAEARQSLRRAGHNLPVALLMLKAGLPAAQARRRLESADGNLRKALREDARGRR